jgi:hypothetical protein
MLIYYSNTWSGEKRLCEKKVVRGISCDSCNIKYHFSYTNMNKEIKKWICKSCAQATRSILDNGQIRCEVYNTAAKELEECMKDLASKTEIIKILLEELTQVEVEMKRWECNINEPNLIIIT